MPDPSNLDRQRFNETANRLNVMLHNDGALRFAKVQPLNFTETTGTVSEIPPPSGGELLALMRKMIVELNKHPPGELAERIDIGKAALEELRHQTKDRPGPQANDPMGMITGIRVCLSDTLDDDQWVAYDRKGNVLATGRLNTVRFLIPERTYIRIDPQP